VEDSQLAIEEPVEDSQMAIEKPVEDSQLVIEEPVGAESAAAATECTPTKGVFGWAVAYLKAAVGK
jgi:hypothetical protein